MSLVKYGLLIRFPDLADKDTSSLQIHRHIIKNTGFALKRKDFVEDELHLCGRSRHQYQFDSRKTMIQELRRHSHQDQSQEGNQRYHFSKHLLPWK